MAQAETAVVTKAVKGDIFPGLIARAKEYAALGGYGFLDYLRIDVKDGYLPVRLAMEEFRLPIKEAGGAKFAWLDPSRDNPQLQQACAIEVGVRLAREMGEACGVVLLPPSKKSTEMGEMAAQIAAGMTGKQILVVKLGGGMTPLPEETGMLDIDIRSLSTDHLVQPVKAKTDFEEEAWVLRYVPVTGKDKFMLLTATQLDQIGIWENSGARVNIIEDVVTTGTTVEVMDRLLRSVDLRSADQVVAVAKEGGAFKGRMVYAIQLPLLD